MGIETLNDVLYKDAKKLGACDKVMGKWQGLYNMPMLIALFKSNQEFCIEKDFPSVEFIQTNTRVDERTKDGLFVNDKVTVHDYSGTIVTLGNSCGFIIADSYDVQTLYIRHNSDLHISCKGFAKLYINVYDNAKVTIEQSEMGKVYVYRYGEKSKIETEGDIIFHQK